MTTVCSEPYQPKNLASLYKEKPNEMKTKLNLCKTLWKLRLQVKQEKEQDLKEKWKQTEAKLKVYRDMGLDEDTLSDATLLRFIHSYEYALQALEKAEYCRLWNVSSQETKTPHWIPTTYDLKTDLLSKRTGRFRPRLETAIQTKKMLETDALEQRKRIQQYYEACQKALGQLKYATQFQHFYKA
jgi:hypothetical protein